MSNVTMTITDTLQETVDSCIEQLQDITSEYLVDNPEKDELCLINDIDYDGRFHEMIDSNVPIYTQELEDNYYLHGNDLDDAFEQSGCYDERPDNYKAVCHYFYLEQACGEWFNNNIDEIMDDFKATNGAK